MDTQRQPMSWYVKYKITGRSFESHIQVPRLIKYLDGKNRGLRDVVCGASFNLGLSEIPGMVNMWGIYTPQKEANMYPKPIQDLSGWNVRSIACNTKVSYNPTKLPAFQFTSLGLDGRS